MTYVPLEVNYYLDPKLLNLKDERAELLYVRALAYSKANGLDGFIHQRILQRFAPFMDEVDSAILAAALVEVDAWEATEDGWRIVAWFKHNLSNGQLDAGRKAESERKRKWRQTRQERRDNNATSSRDETATSGHDPPATNRDDTATRTVPRGRDETRRSGREVKRSEVKTSSLPGSGVPGETATSRRDRDDDDQIETKNRRRKPATRDEIDAVTEILGRRDADAAIDSGRVSVANPAAYVAGCIKARRERSGAAIAEAIAAHPGATPAQIADAVERTGDQQSAPRLKPVEEVKAEHRLDEPKPDTDTYKAGIGKARKALGQSRHIPTTLITKQQEPDEPVSPTTSATDTNWNPDEPEPF